MRAIISAVGFILIALLNLIPEGTFPFSVRWILLLLATALFFFLGEAFIAHGFDSLRGRRFFHPEFLATLALILDTAYSTFLILTGFPLFDIPYSPYLNGSFLVAALSVLALFECRNYLHTSQLVDYFSSWRPQKARLWMKGQEQEMAAADLKPGDVISIYPGESIPCDGIILTGTTSVDESVFLGEDSLRLKAKGDRVTGGSLNRDSMIQIKVETPLEEHFVERTLRYIGQTMRGSLNIRGFYDRILFAIALVSSLTLIALAFMDVLLWPQAISRTVIILGVAGVCKNIQILPHIIIKGILRAAQLGILISTPNLFAKIYRLNTLFFDKTGTLTKGDLHFSQLLLEKGVNQGQLLTTIFSLESQSDHALARAMTTHPWYVEIPRYQVKDFKYHPGLGVSGKVIDRDGRERLASVGNQRFIKRHQMQISRVMRERIDELESMGETVILCGWDGQARAIMSFVDTLRADVKPLLEGVQGLNIKPIMITGDHDEMIGHLSYAHGLQDVYTRCVPSEKASKIKNRQEKKWTVGMVSNSMEEEAAFQQADVGIIIGNGTQLPEKPPSVTIFGTQLIHVATMIRFARQVHGQVKASISIGLATGLAAFALAGIGVIGPVIGIGAMATVSLAFTLLPLRLEVLKTVAGPAKTPATT